MSMFSFKVGKEEVHTIYFSFNRWIGQFKTTVDEKPVRIGNQLIMGSREIKFEVGEKERHKIRITWKIPYFGYLRKLEEKCLLMKIFMKHIIFNYCI